MPLNLGTRIAGVFTTPTPYTPPAPEPAWSPPALSASAMSGASSKKAARQPGGPGAEPLVGQRAPLPQDWQERAWAYYDSAGEAYQAVDWIANGLSRFHLYIGKPEQDGGGDPEPATDSGRAADILTELCPGPIGERDMLYKLATNLLVAGEAWLIGYPPDDGKGSDTRWVVCSRREWQDGSGGGLLVKLPEDKRAGADHWVTFTGDETTVVPVYRPHPRDASYAMSAFCPTLPVLDELAGLDKRVGADIKSRLAGAGVLAVPESATMPTPMQSEGANPLHSDPFLSGLQKAMSAAIKNPDSAEAVTPITVKVADETIAKMQHLTFTTPFDAQIPPLREGARERIAADLDIPKEVVTGIEELNHWASWEVDESALRAHMGPLASLICASLSRLILWPALAASGEKAPRALVIWWDATEVALRTDRSTEALQAYKEGLISGEAARRELGFDEDDAPDEPEQPTDTVPNDEVPQEQDTESGGQPIPGDRPNPPQQPQQPAEAPPPVRAA